jgi:hypothetical protein
MNTNIVASDFSGQRLKEETRFSDTVYPKRKGRISKKHVGQSECYGVVSEIKDVKDWYAFGMFHGEKASRSDGSHKRFS